MRVLILIDGKNFEGGVINLLRKKKEFIFVDFYKINKFVIGYLQNNLQYKNEKLTHVRTYFYTGEYTDKLIDKIEKSLAKCIDKTSEDYAKLESLLKKCKKEQEKQVEFFKKAKNYYFFELRLKPLQFSPSDLKVFQKGVDVQLAADLVDFTHKDIFDVVALLSGDIDLLESVKIAKNEGKHVILFGDSSVTAEEMKKYADMYVDIGRLKEEELSRFTHNKEA